MKIIKCDMCSGVEAYDILNRGKIRTVKIEYSDGRTINERDLCEKCLSSVAQRFDETYPEAG